MSVTGRIEVYGMRDALRELRRFAPEARREVLADMRRAGRPMRNAVAGAIPASPPAGLTGWDHKGRTGWRKTNPKQVAIRTGGRQTRDGSWPLLRMYVRSAAVTIADTARQSATAQGAALVGRLNSLGRPSRFVWPVAERYLPEVQIRVRTALYRAADRTSARLIERPAGL